MTREEVLTRVGNMGLVNGDDLLPSDLVRAREETPGNVGGLLPEVVQLDESNPDEIKALPLGGTGTPIWIFRPLPPIPYA